jgi:outer membrane protein
MLRASLKSSILSAVSVGAVVLLGSSSAFALQPLSVFLEQAGANPDNREALATATQREAEARVSFSRLLPSLSVRGSYTRNEYEAKFPSQSGSVLTVQPYNQFDGLVQLDVPLVDLASYARYRSQQAQVEVAHASEQVTRLEVQKQVVRTWYQLVGAKALAESATKSLDLAERNAHLVQNRRDGGLVSDLDLQRATANVERARQDVGDAELVGTLARRNLETLSGVAPSPVDTALADDLHEEQPLTAWTAIAEGNSPALRQAAAQVRVADASANASRYAYLPSLTGSATEKVSNAVGFTGAHNNYAVTAVLSWRVDFGLSPTMQAQDASVEAAQARQARSARSVGDQIHEAWHRVQTGIAKSRAARAQVSAADRAAFIASERYANGAATQIDVIQAQRDLFAAEVARIQADADLLAARSVLRLSAGQKVSEEAVK